VEPPRAAREAARLVRVGRELLEREDPLAALNVFRQARSLDGHDLDALIGLGRAHLLVGDAAIAQRYGERALATAPDNDESLGLVVRALLRGRDFRAALERSAAATAAGHSGVELLAAHASALFRVQRIDDAAATYRRVLQLDALHAEAHLRLGSGLLGPREVVLGPAFRAASAALRRGDLAAATAALQAALRDDPGNPVLHRVLGETLYNGRAAVSMANTADEYRRLAAAVPWPSAWDPAVIDEFMPAFTALAPDRRKVALRALCLFARELPVLITKGGSHDLLGEEERTTAHPSRAGLRGRRTFDGRVWDDVRGIGGLRAATGVEALDEAAQSGFDTLSHEVAHQVHLHAFSRETADRIRDLYREALAEGRCLDFYAASNFAEYFGQGVEAFVSYGKRPTSEATHGHTRFELMRVDPPLHALIESLVSHDPLDPHEHPRNRIELLRWSIAVALRCGRPADAVTAAELLPDGPERHALLQRARSALLRSRSL
jgi:tetratricopeptide (TPR) repeat protein